MKSCLFRIGRLAKKLANYELDNAKLLVWHGGSCTKLNTTEMQTSFEDEFVVYRAKKSKTEVYLPIEHVLPVEYGVLDELVEIPFTPTGIRCYAYAD